MQNLANKSLVDDILTKVDGLRPIAKELRVPMSQLAIAWVAKNPNVSSVITGATKEHQVICKCFSLIPKEADASFCMHIYEISPMLEY